MNRSLGVLAIFLCASVGAAPLEEISEKTYRMPADGSLSIRNTDGTIYIYAWEESAIKVVARKRSYSPERLKGIAVNVSVDGDAVKIETVYPPKPQGLSLADRSGTVDYLILMPQKARIAEAELSAGEIIISGIYGPEVNARLTNGRITLENCFADTHVSVTDGALDLFYGWCEPGRFRVNAEIAQGHLRIGLPSPTSVRIDAESGDGKISNEFSPADERAGEGGTLHSVIGEGSGAQFKLHAAHGNIGILRNE